MALSSWPLMALVILAAGCSQSYAGDLDELWKFLQQNLGLAEPDFSPMPMPDLGHNLIKKGYRHEHGVFHHTFHIDETRRTTGGEPMRRKVIVPYPEHRLINWHELRNTLEQGLEHLDLLRSRKDGDAEAGDFYRPTGYWDFLPRELAAVSVNKSSVTFASPCYREYTAQFEEVDETGGTLTITVNQTDPYRTDCTGIDKELLTFSSSLGYPKVHLVDTVSAVDGVGKFSIEVLSWGKDEFAAVKQSGMHISVWPLGAVGTIVSLINTTELFIGRDQNALAERNAVFMAERVNYTTTRRDSPAAIVPKESEVRNGDVLHILRLDGLDPLIGWGTGGHTGHDTMVLELNGTLHVAESVAANPFGKKYWPPPYGIISTPYQQWFKQAEEAGYNAVLARLNDDLSRKFTDNLKLAQDFFYSTKGQPYGFHNFVYSFFDTLWYNLPFPITPYLLHGVFNILDRLTDHHTSQMSVYSLITQGLNHRLNTSCTTMECINGELLRRGMLFAEAAMIPEQDSFRYDGQHSMVCDVFITSVFKAAGVVLDTIQATEQTPKDLYQMDIYNKTTDWFPAACKTSPDYDKTVPYCQLLGGYHLRLDNFSTVAQYPMMNEHCHSDPFESYWRGPVPKC